MARRTEGTNPGCLFCLRWSVNLTPPGVLSGGRRVLWAQSACATVGKSRCGGQSKSGPQVSDTRTKGRGNRRNGLSEC